MPCSRCPHCNPPTFRRGAAVKYREHHLGRPQGVGVITSNPRAGSKIAHVDWPDGWAGWCLLEELEVVP